MQLQLKIIIEYRGHILPLTSFYSMTVCNVFKSVRTCNISVLMPLFIEGLLLLHLTTHVLVVTM